MKHLINILLSLISQLVLSVIVKAFVTRRDEGVEREQRGCSELRPAFWVNEAVSTPVASQGWARRLGGEP